MARNPIQTGISVERGLAWCSFLFMLCLQSSGIAAANSAPEQSPVVHVASGGLRGSLQGSSAVFLGIPLAAPPTGALRWKEPQPVEKWTGVRDATKASKACVQDAAGTDGYLGPLAAAYGAAYEVQAVAMSEDCLYLNVWVPDWPHKAERVPVMVWLHGGSNRIGSGAESGYDGASLASHGVIVVTINYRLGVLGFFSHPELTKESPHKSSGNYGLLDQIAALEWVRENIGQFGGDAENVTLFGESAGSIDAMTLVASPLTKGLFRRVIAESGPAFGLARMRTLAEAQAVGEEVGKGAAGVSESSVENLRKLPASAVVELAHQVIQNKFKDFPPNSPIVDGWVLPQTPEWAFAAGAIQRVDILAGLNGRELSAFRVVAAARAKASDSGAKSAGASEGVKKLAETVRPLYGGRSYAALGVYLAKAIVDRDVAIDEASNDMLLGCPIGAEAALSTSMGQHAYVYKFDRSVPGKGEAALGSFHALELPYVFNSFQDRSWRWLPAVETDFKLSRTIQTYWTNFAKTGNPNSNGLATWYSWNSAEEPYLEFDQNGDAIARQKFSPIFCRLSPEGLKQQLSGNPGNDEEPKGRN
jgi:para-nitrobenzyl esterase